MKNTFLIAVYGTLKKGFRNHIFLENSEFIGKGITKEEFIVLRHDNLKEINVNSDNNYEWISKDSSFPILVFPPFGKIKHSFTPKKCLVEIYKIDENTKKAIDILEGYPDMYGLKETEAITDDGKTTNVLIYHFYENNI